MCCCKNKKHMPLKTNLTKFVCGLALLGAVANAPAGGDNMLTLNYSGYFGPTTTLGGTVLPDNTAFSFAATFNAAAPIPVITGLALFSASSFSIVIGTTSYTASQPADLQVTLGDPRMSEIYVAGVIPADQSCILWSYYTGATPAFQTDNPTATEFSGNVVNELSSPTVNFQIALDGVAGGLVINDLGSGAFTANLTASVPEPSQWAAISCFGVLGLAYAAKRRFAKATQ